MSCCGEPKRPNGSTNQPPSQNGHLISQQPSPHPGAFHEKQASFQQPSIPSPAPTHPYGQQSFIDPNAQFQSTSPSNWSHHSPSPPPPVNQFGVFGSPAASSHVNMSYSTTQPLIQPSPVHNGSYRGDSTSPNWPITSTVTSISPINDRQLQGFSPPSDEGKMSISIDFGVSHDVFFSIVS